MSLEPGTTLGAYEILSVVGAGGMGEVYEGRDTRLDRTVAIKVLRAGLADHPEVRARFDREARSISALSHPNICVLHDVGHENGIDYLVMEYLEGETLAAKLARDGAMPPDEMLPIAMCVADALATAHEGGVIHRDLKPGNIMLTKSGAKLLDFGLARDSGVTSPQNEDSLSVSPTVSQPLTTQGTIIGTFQYMSPEQLEGKEVDHRSDIFSLGAVFYEMLTGRPAFSGSSHASLIASVLKEDPPSVRVASPLSSTALDRIVSRCLAKDREQRWQSVADLHRELQWVASGKADDAPAPPARRGVGPREAAAWAVAAVAIAAAAWAWSRVPEATPGEAPASGRVARFELLRPPAAQSEWSCPKPSPDGSRLAFTARDSAGVTSLWIRNLDQITPTRVLGTEGTGRAFWSPDSRHLAFFSGGRLRKVDTLRGGVQTICEAPRGADGAWGSADIILFDGQMGDSLLAVPAAGGTARPASVKGPDDSIHGWPEFCPTESGFCSWLRPRYGWASSERSRRVTWSRPTPRSRSQATACGTSATGCC